MSRSSSVTACVATLTLAQRYALSGCATLARHPKESFVPLADLAAEAHAPAPFLAKLLTTLVAAGIVEGKKGHYGGYRLARASARITIAQVIGHFPTADCAGGKQPCTMGARPCTPEAPCALHNAWSEAAAGLRTLVAETSLADLAAS